MDICRILLVGYTDNEVNKKSIVKFEDDSMTLVFENDSKKFKIVGAKVEDSYNVGIMYKVIVYIDLEMDSKTYEGIALGTDDWVDYETGRIYVDGNLLEEHTAC